MPDVRKSILAMFADDAFCVFVDINDCLSLHFGLNYNSSLFNEKMLRNSVKRSDVTR